MSTADRKVIEIAPSDIGTHPRNPRRVVGDVTDLAESIREVGVLQPATVIPRLDRQDGETPWYFLMGHRRGAATVLAGLPTLPCLVRTDLDTPTKQLKAMVGENDGREDLSPVEQAEAYQDLLDMDCTVDEIARAASKSVQTVRARLGLMKLPESLRERVHVHELTLADAAALEEFVDEPKDLARAEAAIGNEANWRWVIEDIRRARAARAKKAKTLAGLKDKGIRVVNPPKDWQYNTSAKTRPVTQLAQEDGSDYTKPAKQHADCPGHVAVVTDAGSIDWACTRPATHPARAVSTRQDPTLSDVQLEEDLETASRLRVKHVADLFAVGLDTKTQVHLLASVVTPKLAQLVTNVDDEDLALVCQLLGVDGPEGDLDDDQFAAFLDDLCTRPAAMTVERLISWLAACEVIRRELTRGYGHLTAPWPWRRRDSDLLTYMDWLSSLGYEQSDVERGLLADDEAEKAS